MKLRILLGSLPLNRLGIYEISYPMYVLGYFDPFLGIRKSNPEWFCRTITKILLQRVSQGRYDSIRWFEVVKFQGWGVGLLVNTSSVPEYSCPVDWSLQDNI